MTDHIVLTFLFSIFPISMKKKLKCNFKERFAQLFCNNNNIIIMQFVVFRPRENPFARYIGLLTYDTFEITRRKKRKQFQRQTDYSEQRQMRAWEKLEIKLQQKT